jgi:hypothetical protein
LRLENLGGEKLSTFWSLPKLFALNLSNLSTKLVQS